jgi:hypothetical protein
LIRLVVSSEKAAYFGKVLSKERFSAGEHKRREGAEFPGQVGDFVVRQVFTQMPGCRIETVAATHVAFTRNKKYQKNRRRRANLEYAVSQKILGERSQRHFRALATPR